MSIVTKDSLSLPSRAWYRIPCGILSLFVLLVATALFLLLYTYLLDKPVLIQAKPGHMPNWLHGVEKRAGLMKKACNNEKKFDMLWYGDSITESFREEVRGFACTKRCDNIRSVWNSRYGPQTGYKAEALDLQGTNDLGLAALEAGSEDPSKAVQAATAKASKGVQEVIKTFRFLLPDSHIILLGILPRGFKDKSDPDKPVIHYNQPSIFTDPIKQINRELGAFALSQRGVHFLDCGRHFVGADGHLVPGLMPDALHPNAAGMAKLADCVNTVLMPLLANRSIGSAA
eukprot:CAMPEP_0177621658 /NCGR_PEP_ID=MMETSP0419_2-20121207/27705_1 /TAXON_ID=582737 /ORGANISM="Tetraselmis sp., Strain GSL018" /LENGTH=286 /DNA_ID=CAMNT_0019121595 /DNA_START=129 /DNA_END=990 /DNA_ORIENTATION=+